MRKLTAAEAAALHFLHRDGPATPGLDGGSNAAWVRSVLDSLVKKKRATVEATDDGPRYSAIPGVES